MQNENSLKQIWILVAVSIAKNDNYYAIGTVLILMSPIYVVRSLILKFASKLFQGFHLEKSTEIYWRKTFYKNL